MNKRILAVYYSQSGQTKSILDSFLKPLISDGNEIDFLQVETIHKFPFPWSIPVFFDTVPDSVELVPTALEPWHTRYPSYDLVIIAWQPWNLSPSIPISSILQDEKFKEVIKNTPIIMISGCRNMWINAQEKNKVFLKAAGANLVGNIVLFDRAPNHLSYFTIFHWLGTGRKDRMWGIFPKPGVADYDIEHAQLFGKTVSKYLASESWAGLQPELVKQKAVDVKYPLMFIEGKAGKIFKVWVKIINKYPNYRRQLLVAYKWYLHIALLIASPIILFVDLIFFRPFNQEKINKQIQYYSSVALN